MAGARVPTRGRHALRSRAFAADLVRCARVEPDDLVLDLGAGRGIITAALRDAGARVVAVVDGATGVKPATAAAQTVTSAAEPDGTLVRERIAAPVSRTTERAT